VGPNYVTVIMLATTGASFLCPRRLYRRKRETDHLSEGLIMNIRAIAGKTITAVALAGALTGLATGVAEAKPSWGPRCESLHYAFTTNYSLAASALDQGDMQAYRQYDKRGDNNYAAYVKAGCNG
jgi:hypothetical protein